jgi:glycosyltransferase involved in cell wall biosynthesis
VGDRVEIADPVAPNGVVAALREADLGVALIEPANLSYRLTLPNKLFEYALAGLPVLGSDIPMIASFVGEHQVGDVVDPADVDAIAARIGELTEPARNAELRAAVRRAARSLDWSHERQVLERVYREVLRERGRGSRATP